MTSLFKNDSTRTRYRVIALTLFAWMCLIVGRMAWVQIVKSSHWLERAERNQRRIERITPSRGDIVDRNGEELAVTSQSDAIFADLDMIANANEKQRTRIVETLSPLLGLSHRELQTKLENGSENKNGMLLLKSKLPPALSFELRQTVRLKRLTGIGFTREGQRHYPNETLAAHLIGTVSRGEGETGIEGLEKTLQSKLIGLAGSVEYKTDAKGNAFERYEIPARKGARVVTTINLALQHKVEVLLTQAVEQTRAKSATAIVLDPANGEVLALANAPSFNPNERMKELTDAHRYQRKNRALTDIYEPGSVFKLIAYAGALEEGIIHPDTPIDCQGGLLRIPGRPNPIHDSHLGTGVVSATEAFAKSSNVGAVKMGMQLGKERLLDYTRKFGFLGTTGIELPENKGSVLPDSEWKYGAMGVVPIGQGITVTAVQTVSAYAAIANGGVWSRPHLVKEIITAEGTQVTPLQQRRVIRPETASQLAAMMRQVVGEGTGRAADKLAGYTAAGKTGTAQKAVKGRGYADGKFIASFVGFVPASQPRFAIIVVLDEPTGLHQGGQVCAPIFNSIAEAAVIDRAVAPDDETFKATLAQAINQAVSATPTPEPTLVPAPRTTPLPLVSSNLTSTHVPTRNQLERDQVVGAQVMPNLIGKGSRAVMSACTRLQLRMQFEGAGQAVAQQPAPGATIKPGGLCKIKFQ